MQTAADEWVTDDGTGKGWRQVRKRPPDQTHTLYPPGCRWVVAWDRDFTKDAPTFRYCVQKSRGWDVVLLHVFPGEVPAAHRAFVAGTMPPFVYSDWLQENVPDVPAEALAVLRGGEMIERDELTNTVVRGDGGRPVIGRAVYGNGWRVMAWEKDWSNGERMRVGAAMDGRWIADGWHDLNHLDTGPFVAYCRGTMPPFAFADWLEENRVNLPPEAIALLRGW